MPAPPNFISVPPGTARFNYMPNPPNKPDSPVDANDVKLPHHIGELITEIERMSNGAPKEGGLGNGVHYDHQQGIVENIVQQTRCLKRESATTMATGMYRDLGLGEVVKELSEYFTFIKDQTLNGWDYSKGSKTKSKKKGPPIMVPEPTIIHVNTPKGISEMLHAIESVKDTDPTVPLLAVDIEGFDHVNKTISIVEMSVPLLDNVYIIDTLALGILAFSHPAVGLPDLTLRALFESHQIRKIFFDCRSDSEALSKICNVDLQGVEDCQIMDLATRQKGQREKVKALAMVLPQRLHLSDEDKDAWVNAKCWGKLYMLKGQAETERIYAKAQGNRKLIQVILDNEAGLVPASEIKKVEEQSASSKPVASSSSSSGPDPNAGRPAVPENCFMRDQEDFGRVDDRPICPIMQAYCVGDVVLLHQMYQHFVEHATWTEVWEERCRVEVQRRLVESKEVGPLLQERFGEFLPMGPPGWMGLDKKGVPIVRS
ncbi:hypothetical protein MBLNU230_g1179t1 [Neophaeotheca triangularis]